MSNNKQSRIYSITGDEHSRIVISVDEKEAIEIFKKHYNGEEILFVKDISNYNLENLITEFLVSFSDTRWMKLSPKKLHN